VILHPFLFALSPILFLFSYNAARLPLGASELALPLGAALAGTFILWLLLRLLLRDSAKAGVITTAFVLFFFSYGHVYQALHIRRAQPEALLPFWGVLLIVIAGLVIRTKLSLRGLTRFLNLVSAVIVCTNIAFGLPGFLRNLPGHSSARASGSKVGAVTTGYPDIYYIILDAFARDDFLKRDFGVDDSPMLDFLTAHGFRVARQSRPNYSQTYLSLASSLNFEYLDTLARPNGTRDANRVPVTRLIADNRLVRILKEHGYSTMAFASGYAGTEFKNFDIFLAPRWTLSEFENVLLSTTPLPSLIKLVARKSQFDLQRELIRYDLENLPRGARARHPVFVFAHIICPHPPFVFGPHGESVNPPGVFTLTEGGEFQVVDKGQVREDYVQGYAAQVEFLMQKVPEMVSRILAASPSPPVIILQGDHGPGSFLNWDNPSWAALAERFAILNAYHLPPAIAGPAAGTAEVYDSISPVNTFRVVLNRLFGAGLPLLPDRSYFSSITHPYEFYDMSDSNAYLRAVNQGLGTGLTVIAFPHETKSPDQPERYCRRLVAFKYGEAGQTVSQFYIRPVNEDLSVEQAGNLYRSFVQSGALPDLGSTYETWQGPGPDHQPVVALFFRTLAGE